MNNRGNILYNYGTINYNASQPSPAQDRLQEQQMQQATQSFDTSQIKHVNTIPSHNSDGSNNNNSSNNNSCNNNSYNNNSNNSRYDRVKTKEKRNDNRSINFSESTKKLLVE